MESGHHGLTDGFFRLLTDGEDGGASPAEKSSDSARPLGSLDGMFQAWDEGGSVGLMKAVVKGAAGILVFPLQESGGDA